MKKKFLFLLPIALLIFACNNQQDIDNPDQPDVPGQKDDQGGEVDPGRKDDQGGEVDPGKKDDQGGEVDPGQKDDQGGEVDPGQKDDQGGSDQGKGGNTGGNDKYIKDTGIDSSIKSGKELEIEVNTSESEVNIEDSDVSKITDLTVEGISYNAESKIFTINKGGEFTFTGSFNGNILIDAGDDDEIKLTLNNFSIKSKTDSPIKCLNASELQVSIKKGSKNYVYDYRSTKVEDDDSQGNGAITSACDLKISGKGSLFIVARYNNGIHTKDDLTLKHEANGGSSLQIYSYNNCLKGNDSVEIENGNSVLISTNGNGIVTENTDVSSKGNQRGNIDIEGGQIDIYSAKDAIDASYNCEISKGDEVDAPIINIFTSNYSSYSGDVSETATSKMYLRLNNSVNTSDYYFAVEFLTDEYATSWVKSSSKSNTDNRYKYLEVEVPSNATSFKVCSFKNNVTEMSEDTASAKMTDFKTISQFYDVASLTVSGSTIKLSGWTSYQTRQGMGPGGMMEEGNTNKSDVSSKGIKADNQIDISEGQIFIKTYDDAIHANYGDAFENGETGTGIVNISGGDLLIYATDDGVHADYSVNITGGNIDIQYSYEGIEGNLINISGGYSKIYSVDDGLNASNKSGVTPAINVDGGIVDITVYGQDVDGIDSNGSFTQNGGYVISKGTNSNMSTGLDTTGSSKINGGTFVSFGRTETTPSKGSGIQNYTLTGSYSAGDYNILFADQTSVDVTTKYSYTVINVYSDNKTQIVVTKK